MPGQVYPAGRQNEMMDIRERVDRQLPALTQEIFGTFRYPHSVLGQRLWDNCQWAFRADATYLEVALKLARDEPAADLTLLYFGGPDVVGHRFWRYMQPDLFRHRPTREEVLNFGRVIEDYYVYADQTLENCAKRSAPARRSLCFPITA